MFATIIQMLYRCFLDDSKDQHQDKLMVSAGFVASDDEWASLSAAWQKRLNDDGMAYFKTSEYKMLDGEFAKFRTANYPTPLGRQAAQRIRADLQEIMRQHPLIRGIGVSVLLMDYRNVYARPEAKGVLPRNPYQAALVSVMFETAKFVRQRSEANIVTFVHDESDDFDSLHSAYIMFKQVNPDIAPVMGGFRALDDKLHPPLQAADMMANYTLSLGIEGLSCGDMKANVTEMRQNLNLLGFWSEDYVKAVLKRNLIGQGKPIPVDLQSSSYD